MMVQQSHVLERVTASAFIESTLAQIFKRRSPEGSFGGAAYYIEAAFTKTWARCKIFSRLTLECSRRAYETYDGHYHTREHVFRALKNYERQRKEGKILLSNQKISTCLLKPIIGINF